MIRSWTLARILLVAQEMLLVAGLDQDIHQGDRLPEDGVAALAGRQARAERVMALAGA